MGQCIGKPSLAPDIQRTRVSTPSSDKSLRDSATMETGSPRKIQFTVPLLDTHLSHLDPEAAEQIRRRRPTPATLVASSDQSSPEIDEDRLPNQLYKAALLNSPRQRRKGQKGTPTMKELQFMVEHHLYKQQQQGAGGGDEVSSESCMSDRPSPDSAPPADELPHDDDDDEEGDTAEAFEKLRCQMEEFSRESLLEGGLECPLSKEEVGCSNLPVATESSSQPNSTRADTTMAVATASSASQTQGEALWSVDGEIDKSSGRHNAAQSEPAKCSD